MSTSDLPVAVSDPHAAALSAEIDRLRRAVAERDELLALAAHELRNPLHALALHMSLARVMAESTRNHDVAARVARAEAALRRYAERVTVLMELLASPGAAYPVSPRDVDLSELLRSLADGLEEEARVRDIVLRVDAPAAFPAFVDPMAVEQIVDNLLLNAFKHAAASAVTLRLRQEGAMAHVEVADNGRGIPHEEHSRIFRKFERIAHVGQASGSGLGLWIAARLADAVHGSIGLDSAPGSGSVFTLRFPLRQAPIDPT